MNYKGSIVIYADSNELDLKIIRAALKFCKTAGSEYCVIFVSNKPDYEFEKFLIANNLEHGNYFLINSMLAAAQISTKKRLAEFENIIAIFNSKKG